MQQHRHDAGGRREQPEVGAVEDRGEVGLDRRGPVTWAVTPSGSPSRRRSRRSPTASAISVAPVPCTGMTPMAAVPSSLGTSAEPADGAAVAKTSRSVSTCAGRQLLVCGEQHDRRRLVVALHLNCLQGHHLGALVALRQLVGRVGRRGRPRPATRLPAARASRRRCRDCPRAPAAPPIQDRAQRACPSLGEPPSGCGPVDRTLGPPFATARPADWPPVVPERSRRLRQGHGWHDPDRVAGWATRRPDPAGEPMPLQNVPTIEASVESPHRRPGSGHWSPTCATSAAGARRPPRASSAAAGPTGERSRHQDVQPQPAPASGLARRSPRWCASSREQEIAFRVKENFTVWSHPLEPTATGTRSLPAGGSRTASPTSRSRLTKRALRRRRRRSPRSSSPG